MATVLEERNTREQHSVVRFFWAKRLNEKDIHKKMFPVYSRKGLSRKAVHKWVKKLSQGGLKIADDETEVQNWLIQQSKTSLVRVLTQW
jgi:hypothetical protein